MNAALELALAGPPPAAGVLAGACHAGARNTPDRAVAPARQGVARNRPTLERCLNVALGPVGEGVDLDAPVLKLDALDCRSDPAVHSLEARDPALERGERVPERADLSHITALVRVADPKVPVRVLALHEGGVGL